MNIKSERGFTLLEALIVVAVLTVMLSFSAMMIKPYWEKTQKRIFINQLQADLYYAHSYAVHRNERVDIVFSYANNDYQAILVDTGKPLFKKKIPDPIYLSEANVYRFRITPDGTISNFGTVIFQAAENKIKLTFFIGRGRFVIDQ